MADQIRPTSEIATELNKLSHQFHAAAKIGRELVFQWHECDRIHVILSEAAYRLRLNKDDPHG